MNIPWKKKSASVLGIAFEGRRLHAAVLRQDGGGLRIVGQTDQALTLDPLTDDPAKVGVELKSALDQAELREKHCVVGVPIQWTLTNLIKLPEVDEADVRDYLDLQIEKSFPFSSDDLSISISRFQAGLEGHYALVTAVQKKYVNRIGAILASAGLKPVGYPLSLQATQAIQGSPGQPELTLCADAQGVSLMVTAADGSAACIRTLKDVIDGGDREISINEKALAREIRVTLGQLPATVRKGLETIHVYGDGERAQRLTAGLAPRAEALHLAVKTLPAAPVEEGVITPPLSGAVSPALALAAAHLASPAPQLNYLPPQVTALEKIFAKVGSRKLGTAGAVIGAFLLIVIVAFLWQGRTLGALESKWANMKDDVQELEKLNGKSSRFRSWYQSSQPNLQILQSLAQAFPEDGSVTALNIEINDRSIVTCTGIARNSLELQDVKDRMREIPQIQDIKTPTMTGNSPIKFTIEYRWDESRRKSDESS